MSEVKNKKPADVTLEAAQARVGGRYQLTSMIGQGGMATVYAANQIGLDKVVAIKVLNAQVEDKPIQAARLHLEAKAAASLSHENIARVHDYGDTSDGQAFVAMEYVPGKTLSATLASRGRLQASEALPIFVGIGKGLEAAHNAQIIHRDVKPSNVILAELKNGLVPKITDFGLVKVLDVSDQEMNKLTQTAEIIGSPSYMSPEQSLGLPVDFRTDIYSFGCLMFETVVGECPFAGENVMQTLMQHVHAPRAALKEKLNQHVSSDLAAIIEGCLHQDKDRRYQSMQAVIDDLLLCSQGQTVKGPRDVSGKIFDLTRKPILLVGSLIFLLVLCSSVLLLQPKGANSPVFELMSSLSPSFPQPHRGILQSLRGEVLYLSPNTTSERNLLEEAAEKVSLPAVDLTGKQLPRVHLQGANLSGASFRSANLSGAVLSKCGLGGAHFEGASCPQMAVSNSGLQDVNFTNTNLYGAKFYHCDWRDSRGLSFEGADLRKAEFTDCSFNYCDLRKVFDRDRNVKLTRCTFTDSDLQGSNLSYADLTSCEFVGANLSGTNLTKANLCGVPLSHAKFADAELAQVALDRADLRDANLQRANLTNATLSQANLKNANFAGAVLTGASLFGADLSGANFEGANLTDVVLTGAKLEGANFKNAILPAKYKRLE